jgi:hypothetical protein
MTTQQDRRNRETVRRTSRHRETGKPEDHRRDAAAESSAAKHRRFAGGAPAAGKYSGTEITLDNEQYLILRESDVLAVVA